jgi:hypothetical protein
MKIFNETAKTRISAAYDMFKRDEFLDRLFKFMDDSEDLIYELERRKRQADELCQKIIEGAKTKPGPKAKSELELT